jgi:hypothetical protein
MATCDDLLTTNRPGNPDIYPWYTLEKRISDLNKMVKLSKIYPNSLGINIYKKVHHIPWNTWK